AELLLHDLEWHFARPEPLDPGCLGRLVQARTDLTLNALSRHAYGQPTPQIRRVLDGYLHATPLAMAPACAARSFIFKFKNHTRRCRYRQRRALKFLVRKARLELAHPRVLEPKSSASTSSATFASHTKML